VKKRTALLSLLAVGAVAAALALAFLPVDGTRPAPAATFTLLDGRNFTLAELRERPVLVSFWATTCPPCLEELPDLIRLYDELHPRGFELIAVAMPYDSPLHVRNFVQRHGVPYPVALDVDGGVTRAFGGVPFIPAAFLISPEGRIVYQHTGKLDTAKLRRMIDQFARTGAPSP
jgi:peroxiredoxin